MKPIIEVKNLSKKYKYGETQPYYTLRDTLTSLFKSPMDLIRKDNLKKNEFWALKDISFGVKEGEVLGVIGPNGAGKSTLLKVLSRITPPTAGKAILRGRVGSLLEVGTGFHQELTGRENIYLNGAILGMTRKEIKSKFDEIVEFSGIEKFLDTPVKHYSSGMYVRLAFAVAAHLDPEILLVDEVLAVGDTEFQKRSLKRMDDIAKSGKTILFVSHNIEMIQKLCKNTLLLKNGAAIDIGNSNRIIQRYLNYTEIKQTSLKNVLRQGKGEVHFTEIMINKNNQIVCGENAEISIKYASKGKFLKNCRVGIAFRDITGTLLFVCSTEQYMKNNFNLKSRGIINCLIPKLPLSAGSYHIELFIEVNHEIQDWIKDISVIVGPGVFHEGLRQQPIGFEGKGVLVKHEWNLN